MPAQLDVHMKRPEHCNLLGPCASVYTAVNTGSWRIEYPRVDFAVCKRCGICARFCPCNVIVIDRDANECVRIDWNYCKGCGICANECPQNGITMEKESERIAAYQDA